MKEELLTLKEAIELLHTPIEKFTKKTGVGKKRLMALAEHYRKLVLAKEEVIAELYRER